MLDGADLTNADVTGANTNKITCVGTIVSGLVGGPLGCAGAVTAPPAPPSVPMIHGPVQTGCCVLTMYFFPAAGVTSYTLTATPFVLDARGRTDGTIVSTSGLGVPLPAPFEAMSTLTVEFAYVGIEFPLPCGVSLGWTLSITATGPGGVSEPNAEESYGEPVPCPEVGEEEEEG